MVGGVWINCHPCYGGMNVSFLHKFQKSDHEMSSLSNANRGERRF